MILGLDHLALSAVDTDAAILDLSSRGYELAFMEKGIFNPPVKRPLLQHYQPVHDLAVLRSKAGGVTIEVTDHGRVCDDVTGPYHLEDGAIVLRTATPDRDRDFLVGALKFHGDGNDLVFRSPVRGWCCRLRLVEAPHVEKATLDAAGHPCVALLCKGIDSDRKTIFESGGTDVTPPFPLKVNGRPLNIVMFRLPGGALGELIEPNGPRS